MICQNCGKKEANVKYMQVINGVKKEMHLCDSCAKELGIEELDFSMPISFSSFLSDILEDYTQDSFMPDFIKPAILQCKHCGMTYDDFLKLGKFGCEGCYDAFENTINPLLKNIHGANHHVGRNSRLLGEKEAEVVKKVENKQIDKLEELRKKLKEEIKEERYEDAAKTRDAIKKMENEQ